MTVDLAELRSELIQAVTGAVEEVLARHSGSGVPVDDRVTVLSSDDAADFTFKWPDQTEPTYDHAARYAVAWKGREFDLLIGDTATATYGRPRKLRSIFLLTSSDARYPLQEFTEIDTDATRYAGKIAKPGGTGRQYAAADDLENLARVTHLANADIRPVGDLFLSVRDGKTLRLVAEYGDVTTMLTHALWSARQRGIV